MKIAYVAGPYSGRTENEVHENIESARRVAVELWKQGYAVICPHMNSASMDGVVPYKQFLQADRLFIKHADAFVLTPGWSSSRGARSELTFARQLGLPVGEVKDGVITWDIDSALKMGLIERRTTGAYPQEASAT